MNSGTKEHARMRDIFAQVGKQLRQFACNKDNVCICALTKDRPDGDLFAPCIYAFSYSDINSKSILVYDNKTSSLDELKKQYNGIIVFRCVENSSERTMTCKIDNNIFEVIYYICGNKFENDDGFIQFGTELGFD